MDFGEWVTVRRGSLLRTAYLLTADRHSAEDLVQSTLERVALRWERIVANGPPEAYVRQVLYRQHVSAWRRHRGRERVGTPPERAVDDPAPAADLRIVLDGALRRLSHKQRAVLVLRYYEDLSEVQTAQALGVRLGTVKSQTRDALQRLRILAPELQDLIGGPAPDDGVTHGEGAAHDVAP